MNRTQKSIHLEGCKIFCSKSCVQHKNKETLEKSLLLETVETLNQKLHEKDNEFKLLRSLKMKLMRNVESLKNYKRI